LDITKEESPPSKKGNKGGLKKNIKKKE